MALVSTIALTATAIAQTDVELCTLRYSDEIDSASPTGSVFIAVPAFKVSCQGTIYGSLNVRGGKMARTQLQIEQKIDNQWRVVQRGHILSHQAQPGTYRLSVIQSDKTGGFAKWTLHYAKPLP